MKNEELKLHKTYRFISYVLGFTLKPKFFVFSSFFFLLSSSFLSAQPETRQERIEQLQRNIELTEELERMQKNRQENETSLNLLNSRISSRKALLNEMSSEFMQLSNNVDTLNVQIAQQQARLAALKDDYAKMLQYIHTQQKGKNKWMFILSAENFSQSYRRFRYMQKLTEHAGLEMEQIQKLTAQLEAKMQQAENTRVSKIKLIQQQEAEARKLSAEQSNQEATIQYLKQQEADLLKAIRERERQTEGLNVKIQSNTAHEARGGLTQLEEQELTKNFERSKGLLPMPVERGFVSGRFGKQQHPVLAHVTTDNKGINIQTTAGSDALAVFEGVVSQRFAFPGYNNAVIVRHGNYRTVYSNLTEVFVNEGDIVSANQRLGKIFVDKADGNKTELFFLVYKDKALQNPELFIRR